MNIISFKEQPQAPRHAIVASFDLSGFSVFCQRHDAQPFVNIFIAKLFRNLETVFNEDELSPPKPDFMKYTGDGAVLLWVRSSGADFDENVCTKIVVSLREFQQQLPRNVEIWEREMKTQHLPRTVRVGIANGPVYPLSTPEAPAGQHPEDYAGYPINLAVRLQDHCFEVGFLIHDEVRPVINKLQAVMAIGMKGCLDERVLVYAEDFNRFVRADPSKAGTKFHLGGRWSWYHRLWWCRQLFSARGLAQLASARCSVVAMSLLALCVLLGLRFYRFPWPRDIGVSAEKVKEPFDLWPQHSIMHIDGILSWVAKAQLTHANIAATNILTVWTEYAETTQDERKQTKTKDWQVKFQLIDYSLCPPRRSHQADEEQTPRLLSSTDHQMKFHFFGDNRKAELINWESSDKQPHQIQIGPSDKILILALYDHPTFIHTNKHDANSFKDFLVALAGDFVSYSKPTIMSTFALGLTNQCKIDDGFEMRVRPTTLVHLLGLSKTLDDLRFYKRQKPTVAHVTTALAEITNNLNPLLQRLVHEGQLNRPNAPYKDATDRFLHSYANLIWAADRCELRGSMFYYISAPIR